jgi:hypothetical protein
MIKLFHKILSIVFLAITLSGCGGHQKTFIALSPELKQQIGSTDVYLEECEQKISAETEKSNMGLESGSLLLMLADSAIESNRQRAIEKAIQDIQKELETYELRQALYQKLWPLVQQKIEASQSLDEEGACWKNYKQIGMKPGKNGKPVPDCRGPIKETKSNILKGLM